MHARRDDKQSAFLTSLSFSEDYLAAHTPEAAQRLTTPLVASAPGPVHRDALRVAVGTGSGPAPDRLLTSTAALLLPG
ncbi:hypothetical protein GCM10011579_088040 [Streptomyces albiflavescens]|uniref:Uncharacterized protein n=1 Tax=Streptomyces albiflavescens TaxID=1623582 RepID=A0A918DAP5_9ACTN|nr:hypothetical protein GCM10011579_088040 [Streptomyces albiflavescens]